MSAGGVISGAFVALMGFVFMAFGLWFYNMKNPAWFWAGSVGKIKADDLTDVRAYNRANGAMWLVYGGVWLAAGVVSAVHVPGGLLLMTLALVIGVPFMVVNYKKIWRKYGKEGVKDPANY